ncbi:MAG: phosphotransferase family protein [Candidatus Zixiibacteriota bacterium]
MNRPLTHDVFFRATDSKHMLPRLEELLQKQLGTEVRIESLDIPRVVPGRKALMIQYVMQLHGESLLNNPLTCCGTIPYVGKANKKASAGEDRIGYLRDLNLTVPLFPFDPAIEILQGLANKDRAGKIITDCLTRSGIEHSELCISNIELLAYRQGKRCVLRYHLSPAQAKLGSSQVSQIVLRAVRQSRLKPILDGITLLQEHGFTSHADDQITIPHVFAADSDEGFYIMESIRGQSLYNLKEDEQFEAGCRMAGLVLRKLHSISAVSSTVHSAEGELAQLQWKVALVCGLFPDLSSRFEQAFHSVQAKQAAKMAGFDQVTIHGDFYDKQVIYAPRRTTLLDLDSLSAGDPAMDFGNFMAHIELRELQYARLDADIVDSGRLAFGAAYGEIGSGFEGRATWWKAVTLLRLAALYVLRPRWRHLASPLLDQCNVVLKSSTFRCVG